MVRREDLTDADRVINVEGRLSNDENEKAANGNKLKKDRDAEDNEAEGQEQAVASSANDGNHGVAVAFGVEPSAASRRPYDEARTGEDE